MGKNLLRIEAEKLFLGLKKLSAHIDVPSWLAMLDADAAQMKQLKDAWPLKLPSLAYDAVAVLGFGECTSEPLPLPKAGEVVLRYGGWSFQELCDSAIGLQFSSIQDWHLGDEWTKQKYPAGIYRLPIRRGRHQFFEEGENYPFAVLAATVMLVHHLQTGRNLFKEAAVACREKGDWKGFTSRIHVNLEKCKHLGVYHSDHTSEEVQSEALCLTQMPLILTQHPRVSDP